MAITINADTTNGLVMTPDTSGEINLQASGVTQAKITTNGLQDGNGNPLRGGMYRNLIINGDMRIDQRNAGASVTPTATAYLTDRWQLQISGVTNAPTYQQVTDAPTGFQYSLKATVNSSETLTSEASVTFRQRIEGFNTAHLLYGTSDAKTVTVSFWVKSSLTGTFNVSIANSGFNRAYITEYTISSANTWEYKTITIAGDTTGTWSTDNTTGLLLMFNLDTGSDYDGAADTWLATNDRATVGAVKLLETSGATWQITGVQLEVGEGASDFEFLPYDVQLQRCMRYYWQSGNRGVLGVTGSAANSSVVAFVTVPVPLRATPTVSYASGGNDWRGNSSSAQCSISATGITAEGQNTKIWWLQAYSSGSLVSNTVWSLVGSPTIYIEAEL